MSYYQGLFSQRTIEKHYLAVVQGAGPELGHYRYWMQKSKRSPKEVTDKEIPNSSIIELNILNLSKFDLPGTSLVDIELLTGKTHQIRSQLSHLGFPLRGDHLYGGTEFPKGSSHDHFLLHSARLEFDDSSGQRQQFVHSPLWL